FLLPAFAGFTAHALEVVLRRPADATRARFVAVYWLFGALISAVGMSVPEGILHTMGAAMAALVLTAAAILTTGLLLRAIPKRSQSVVDVKLDPLTKGD